MTRPFLGEKKVVELLIRICNLYFLKSTEGTLSAIFCWEKEAQYIVE